MSEQSYIETSSEWGGYGYIKLEQLINDYLANRDEDDYTFNSARHQIIYQAKQGIRKLYYDVVQEVKAIELAVSSSLQVVLPEDYVNYVRISWLKDFQLYPMVENKDLDISRVYLQDNDYNLLFDLDGNILQSENQLDPNTAPEDQVVNYNFCPTTFGANVDFSKVNNGSYKIDKDRGVIKFSSDVFSKDVVIEYISDGLYFDTNKGESEADIKVHKFAEQAVIDFMYYQLIKQRRHVPANEKQRARKEFYNSMRLAKRRINQANRQELLQSFKKSDMWIKGLN